VERCFHSLHEMLENACHDDEMPGGLRATIERKTETEKQKEKERGRVRERGRRMA